MARVRHTVDEAFLSIASALLSKARFRLASALHVSPLGYCNVFWKTAFRWLAYGMCRPAALLRMPLLTSSLLFCKGMLLRYLLRLCTVLPLLRALPLRRVWESRFGF